MVSSSEEETYACGEALASLLEKGSIVALNGPLGAGKTCFTKGIAKGLCIAEEITSPTYTIINEYAGDCRGEDAGEKRVKVSVYHIDAYRLGGNDDFTNLGGEEIVFGNGISIIEWSERIPAFVTAGAFKVDITINDDAKRSISIYQ